jgi:hypothetical protein
MPINISYQPAAGLVAGSSLLAGQGQYAQNANQLLTQQWQTAAQIQNSRLMAMAQAAQDAQMQQNQQNFQMQQMPVQAAYQQQNQAFQSQLGTQADAQQQMLRSYLGSQQSTQDAAEQQQLSAQQAQQQADNQAAQITLQQQGQLSNQQQMAQFNSDQQMMGQFQDGSYQKRLQQIQQQATQDGSSYTDAQQQQIQTHQQTLQAAQSAVGPTEGAGTATTASVMPAVKQAMTALSNIYSNPGKPPPVSPSQQFAQGTVWYQPNATEPSQIYSDTPSAGAIPVQLNKKTQQWESKIIRPGDVAGGGSRANDEAKQDMEVLEAGYKAEKMATALEAPPSPREIKAEVENRWHAGLMDKDDSVNQPGWREAMYQQVSQEMMQEHAQNRAAGKARVEADKAKLPQRGVGPQAAPAGGAQPPPAGIPAPAPQAPVANGQPQVTPQNPQGQPQQAQPAANPNDQSNMNRDRPWAEAVMHHAQQHPDLNRWSTEDLLALRKARMILGSSS